jgi:two-component system OmpR family response regulator
MDHNSATRILVIDSGSTVRGELAGRLGALGFCVVVADHVTAIARLLEVYQPDLVVAEILDDHPEDTVSMIRSLNQARLIATVPSTLPPERRVRAIRAGADDVIVKPFDINELLVRIETLRSRYFGGDCLMFEDVRIDEAGHQVYRGEAILDLTVTEFNLLAMLVRNAGRVISKRQLLATIWGFDDYDVNLVEVHVSALRKKLEASGPRIVQTVRGIGYVLRSVDTHHVQQPALHIASAS